MNYYNEFDPQAAAWLRELINAGHIPQGEVDERSITEILPDDLLGFTQCHFFAGIGGWSLALKLAGWPEDRPVWTGSCPCQPFSNAGKQRAQEDERHLWPIFGNLISERRPATIFGEQVASKLGREWLDGVCADLEGMGYAVAGADLCAASVGAPHIRQRLYWLGNANSTGREPWRLATEAAGYGNTPQSASGACGLGDTNGSGFSEQCRTLAIPQKFASFELRSDSCNSGMGNSASTDQRGYIGIPCIETAEMQREAWKNHGAEPRGSGAWSKYDILPCSDGKARRVESGSFPLVNGFPGRVGLLRGYGNAIVPPLAAEFIKASGLI